MVGRGVSIRSPRRNEGRCGSAWVAGAMGLFQSAPPVETRGDMARRTAGYGSARFQSAPPVETRGDIADTTHRPVEKKFQSAPPVETRGDLPCLTMLRDVLCFNPLPPSKRGEIDARGLVGCRIYGFNPLPPSKRGEISPFLLGGSPAPKFQSAPPVETRGDVWSPGTIAGGNRVSIRSPRRNEGR